MERCYDRTENQVEKQFHILYKYGCRNSKWPKRYEIFRKVAITQKIYQTEFIFSIAFWNSIMNELRIKLMKRSIFGTNMAANIQNSHGLKVHKFS